jgi:hypothetical protein
MTRGRWSKFLGVLDDAFDSTLKFLIPFGLILATAQAIAGNTEGSNEQMLFTTLCYIILLLRRQRREGV